MLLLFCFPYVIVCAPITAEYEGTLEPIDPELCTSQDITFTCTLDSPPVTGNSLGFAVKNSSTNRKDVPVEEERVDFISPTVANLTLYNITVKTFVKCFYWENFGDVDDTKMIGQASTITVYRKHTSNITLIT